MLHNYLQYSPPEVMNFDEDEDSTSEEDDDDDEGEEECSSSVMFAHQPNLVVASTPWAPPTTTVYQILNTSPVYNVLQPLQAATSPVVYLAGANHLQIQPQNVQLQHQNLQQQSQGIQLPSQEVQLQPQGVIITPVYNLAGPTTTTTTATPVVYLHNNHIQTGIPLYAEDENVVVDGNKENLIESPEEQGQDVEAGFHESKFFENESESDLLCDQDTNDIFKLLDSNDNLDFCFEDLQSSLKLFMEDNDQDIQFNESSAEITEDMKEEESDENAEEDDEEDETTDDEESNEDKTYDEENCYENYNGQAEVTENVRDIIEIIPLGQDYHPANVIELIPGVHLKELAAGGNIFESENSNGTNFVIPYTNYGELTIGNTTITKIPQTNNQQFKENNKPKEQRMKARTKAKETPAEKRSRIKKMHDGEPPEIRKQRLRHLAKLARERRSKETEEERRFRLDRNSRQKKEKRRQNKSQYVFHVQLLPNGKYVTTCIPKNNQKN
ncbi:hypothetical protein ACFFRR_002349 [Megaselia abdita]